MINLSIFSFLFLILVGTSQTQAQMNTLGVNPYEGLFALTDHSVCAVGYQTLRCWGHDRHGLISKMPKVTEPRFVTSGADHMCVLAKEGLKCWGSNTYGQLKVPTLKNPRWVLASGYHTCAGDQDYSVKCWGLLEATLQFKMRRFQEDAYSSNAFYLVESEDTPFDNLSHPIDIISSGRKNLPLKDGTTLLSPRIRTSSGKAVTQNGFVYEEQCQQGLFSKDYSCKYSFKLGFPTVEALNSSDMLIFQPGQMVLLRPEQQRTQYSSAYTRSVGSTPLYIPTSYNTHHAITAQVDENGDIQYLFDQSHLLKDISLNDGFVSYIQSSTIKPLAHKASRTASCYLTEKQLSCSPADLPSPSPSPSIVDAGKNFDVAIYKVGDSPFKTSAPLLNLKYLSQNTYKHDALFFSQAQKLLESNPSQGSFFFAALAPMIDKLKYESISAENKAAFQQRRREFLAGESSLKDTGYHPLRFKLAMQILIDSLSTQHSLLNTEDLRLLTTWVDQLRHLQGLEKPKFADFVALSETYEQIRVHSLKVADHPYLGARSSLQIELTEYLESL